MMMIMMMKLNDNLVSNLNNQLKLAIRIFFIKLCIKYYKILIF